MLTLEFRLGGHRYGLDVREIVEVLPLVRLQPVPQAPPSVAGLLDYRGLALPVVDLSVLLTGEPSRSQRSTRIIVVRYGGIQRLGLLAEQVTQTTRLSAEQIQEPPVGVPEAPFLGQVACDGDQEMLVFLKVDQLLGEDIKAMLYPDSFTDPQG